jgi:hypothetical protein
MASPGVEVDVLDGEGVFGEAVDLAAPLGLSDVDPVCRLAGRPGEPPDVDQAPRSNGAYL